MRHFGYTFWWDNLMRQLMRHFEEIFLWDILMRYFGETFWSSNFGETYRWDIWMRHFNETIWSDIVMSHFDETYWWDTLMRPLDETYWWDTLMRQIDEKFVRPLKNFNDRWLPLMTFDMVMMLMGWPLTVLTVSCSWLLSTAITVQPIVPVTIGRYHGLTAGSERNDRKFCFAANSRIFFLVVNKHTNNQT